MISYLKGQVTDVAKNSNNRFILVLEVGGIGYELQIPSRLSRQISVNSTDGVQVFTHLQVREDQQILYGFASTAERDLFRQLISVTGIGTQLAIALIDTFELSELVQAIVTGNIRLLIKTPGVGKKTAERISLELKTKLSQWRNVAGITTSTREAMPDLAILEDVELTLLALGYTNEEIDGVISILAKDQLLMKNPTVEEWIRSAIAWLSKDE
jgi:holliday junction DNA helicase RuvA